MPAPDKIMRQWLDILSGFSDLLEDFRQEHRALLDRQEALLKRGDGQEDYPLKSAWSTVKDFDGPQAMALVQNTVNTTHKEVNLFVPKEESPEGRENQQSLALANSPVTAVHEGGFPTHDANLPETPNCEVKAVDVKTRVREGVGHRQTWRQRLGDIEASQHAVATATEIAVVPEAHRNSRVSALGGETIFQFHTKVDKSVLADEEYHVESFYKDTGCAQSWARSDAFAKATYLVIFLNAVYIGVDMDWNTGTADWRFIVSDQFFCLFFTVELVIRFASFRVKADCLKDNWFKFDTLLVVMMIGETWLMPVAQMILQTPSVSTGPTDVLRLCRLARMMRLAKFLPELLTMMNGMRSAARAVLSSIIMLSLMMYVVGAIMHAIMSFDMDFEKNFSTLPRCMFTLLMDGTFMDSTGNLMWRMVDKQYFLAMFIFHVYIWLSSMLVMNMLIGILCEVVAATAQTEKDNQAISRIKNSLLLVFKAFDSDDTGTISWDELMRVIESPGARCVLADIAVDIPYLVSYCEMLFEDDDELPITEIMDLVLKTRGDLEVTSGDIFRNHDFVFWQLKTLLNERLDGKAADLPSR